MHIFVDINSVGPEGFEFRNLANPLERTRTGGGSGHDRLREHCGPAQGDPWNSLESAGP